MATSPAQKLATKKYRAGNIDVVSFDVKKGKRDEYKAAAAAMGLGQMEMIRRAIEEYIANHGEGVPTVAPVKPAFIAPQLSSEQRKILDTIESLPPDARRALMKFLHALQAEQSVAEKATVD